ncbi:NADPH:adrenodoxin oxidoreductase, mitochondrial [Chionoecetes opilio]|uniref:NADPH:adrenodoxin oxidoreductase, mitochondrial n=1 Tax=Chionoecetes opilio TaxID=41210 RepID=A0A8J5CGS4_CHIOP|nr:NADPH:adrenodoxin oxidoreductase, mitochondrial [Chionoecetes opilio]
MLGASRRLAAQGSVLAHAACLSTVPRVCVVGSGPAGFYTAQQILKSHATAQVDMYEKLPTPFGLVRYGVAPDHPEVKNCINTFTQTASQDRFTFLGNVEVGRDVTLDHLREAYHAIVLAYGAAEDRTLGIPGESLANVLSARRFVGWYNGLPDDASISVDLNTDSAVVVGQGNVAIDVARILLTPIDILKKTDIPESVLASLAQSRVKRVTLVGRRGPQHVAFTIKELREMVNLAGCRPSLQPSDYQHLRKLIPDLPRPRKRLLELLAKTALDEPNPKLGAAYASAERQWSLQFLGSPVEVLASGGHMVSGLKLAKNRLEGKEGQQRAVATEETETLECGLVLRSVGYRGHALNAALPFDSHTATIANMEGRVTGHPGLYVSGWIATGPVGVILSTMTSGFNTGKAVVADIKAAAIDMDQHKEGKSAIGRVLAEKGVEVVSFKQWLQLDQYEMAAGARLGKPREKVTTLRRMMELSL